MFRGIVPSAQRRKSGLRSQFWLIALLAGCQPLWGQTPPRQGTGSDPGGRGAGVRPQSLVYTGQVVDARTGAPLEKVLVVVEDAGKSVLTDAEGRFRIEG